MGREPGEGGRENDERSSVRDTLPTAPTALRIAAIVLLVVGFVGIVETGADPLAIESMYSRAFLLGIACAFASIYLGIFRQGA